MDTQKKKLIFYSLFIIICYFGLIWLMPYMDPDEARYVEIPREMMQLKHYIIPYLNYTVYLEKPPLYYWMNIIALKIFGFNDFAGRFWTVTISLLGIFLNYKFAKKVINKKTAFWSSLILASSLYYFLIGRLNLIDMTNAFFISMSTYCGYLFLKEHKKYFLYLMYAGMALGFLSKALIGIIFPFAILFLWSIFTKQFKSFFKLISPVGIIILLALCMPWIYMAGTQLSDFYYYFFLKQEFLRYLEPLEHTQPIWTFIPVVIFGFLPWIIFVFSLFKTYKATKFKDIEKNDLIFLLTFVGFIFVFYSLSQSKLVTYVAPLFFPAAIILGNLFSKIDTIDKKDKYINLALFSIFFIALVGFCFIQDVYMSKEKWFLLILPSAIALIILGVLPFIIKDAKKIFASLFFGMLIFYNLAIIPTASYTMYYKTTKPVALFVNKIYKKGDILASYKLYRQSFNYYTQKRTVQVDSINELGFGYRHLSPKGQEIWFPTIEQFKKVWDSDHKVILLIKTKEIPKFAYKHYFILLKEPYFSILSNKGRLD
ncbi:Polymyxin resistance protein ArnT [Desulfurella amilsii]|uniref:Polymyxin resistance protein ArnT n=1 Tax=Desulfurella amilsii TaxID=1562698 RepID=A0A1X4XWD7_9BACT|nr:glycosyltransferase family 39 protein [Desulfurella amilsii]OSS41852.1 Polymyxin resistance protein ArnT [Desulfurella amilsii]